MESNDKKIKTTGYNWLGRSLDNYKQQHRNTSESKGVQKEFMLAKTLTQAKKILFGYKRKNSR